MQVAALFNDPPLCMDLISTLIIYMHFFNICSDYRLSVFYNFTFAKNNNFNLTVNILFYSVFRITLHVLIKIFLLGLFLVLSIRRAAFNIGGSISTTGL